uniref:ARAD1C19272p n=1 Tax=Blastobotrys adeninivorans TaxID=409370 RepID=A0A060T1C5_BLAAD
MSAYLTFLRGVAPFRSEYSKGYPDQSGRTWLVTGVTVGGIGFESSRLLLKAGATKLWIVGRNPEKLDQAIEALQKEFTNANVAKLVVDFDDLTSVKPGLEPLLSSTTELHGVIHNAGIMLTPTDQVTKQGFDKQIGVNTVAPFLIQRFLDDLLISGAKNSPPNTVRVVWVSSDGQLFAPCNIDFSELKTDSNSSFKRYCHSKALNVMQAILWDRKHEDSGVLSVSVHPGVTSSDISRQFPAFTRGLVKNLAKPPLYGAYSEMYAALSPDLTLDNHRGAYIFPFGAVGSARSDLVNYSKGADGDKVWERFTEVTDPYM